MDDILRGLKDLITGDDKKDDELVPPDQQPVYGGPDHRNILSSDEDPYGDPGRDIRSSDEDPYGDPGRAVRSSDEDPYGDPGARR